MIEANNTYWTYTERKEIDVNPLALYNHPNDPFIFTITETNMNNKPKEKTLKKLKLLQKKEAVKIIGRVAPNRSYIWKLNRGENKIE